ncbi:MAG: hypothetical protein ACLQDY_25410 [Streptosporangiaceae bacterium]
MPADTPGRRFWRPWGSVPGAPWPRTAQRNPARPADAVGARSAPARPNRPIGRAAPAVFGWLVPGRSRSRRPVLLAGVAVVALLAGASAALEVTEPAARPALQATSASGGGARRVGAGPGGAAGRVTAPGGLAGLLHGTFIQVKPGGGDQTVFIQTGRITAVGHDAITVRSADGYTRRYAVTGSTVVGAQRGGIGSLRAGESVVLMATLGRRTAAAERIRELPPAPSGRAVGYPR